MSWSIEDVAIKIAGRKYDLADKITAEQSKKHPEVQASISAELREQRIKLIDMYKELLIDDLDTALNKITRWGVETGTALSEMGMTIDMALDELPYYRNEMAEVICEEAEKHGVSFKTYNDAISKLHRIIDQAAQSFSVAFVRHNKHMIESARAALNELSVPVVPLTEGVAVLPLVGEIDEERANLLMEKSLVQSTKLKVSCFIMDLSGVPVVDTIAAKQIFQVTQALSLLGIKAAVSGIRPEMAQKIVNLGIDFTKISTYSTLQQAINSLKP
ncbi:rsbT co-antagonist protein RsbR [Peribacillus deserti]|uniref:RsbT co-antagonist protein RsbR n=1 Tax=Peribacillus deserti TaxID=673318 RepID=A0ABS2QMH8_9BACI|nr:STAS domain-containing protein [Peribacillus deserti]MBM7693919.1 rsbT co-antagonist protein RsbR [Peribacillus deserti]